MAGFIEPLPGNATFTDKLMGIAARAKTVPEFAFPLVEKSFHALEAHQWASESGWAPLTQATLDRKARGNWGDKDMVRTGDLAESLITGGGYGFTEITPRSILMATNAPYAGYHQFGSDRMPARPIVTVDEKTAVAWGLVIEAYVFSGLL